MDVQFMKRLFDILPTEFFKPLTSKYKREYADCIMLLLNSFKPEISYGVNREIVVKTLTDYFEADDVEMTFDDEHTFVRDAREKANGVIAVLRSCGWIEYEQEMNHQLNVVLYEYAIPVIESMNRIIREEEAEYQGIISQIHASLQNEGLYSKPYELIIKGVEENTERLLSELKKLNASIKRHMEKQTNDMDAGEILEHFFAYHQNIGSKAYLRMKTSENISYFRSAIIERLEYMLESPDIMERAVAGYMEVEEVTDADEAYDNLVSLLLDVKSSFYRLDDIIEEIDKKHARYMRNAVMRAKFLLATGNNLEGKLSKLLNQFVEELNCIIEEIDKKHARYMRNAVMRAKFLLATGNNLEGKLSKLLNQFVEELNCGREKEPLQQLQNLYALFPQNYISPESLQTIPVTKNWVLWRRCPGKRG